MHIIGLGHYARTGKDTFATLLCNAIHERGGGDFVVEKTSFAWKLKQICHELYGWDGLREPEYYDTEEGSKYREIPLRHLQKSPRQIWVDFGTPAVRACVYEGTWRDYVFNTPRSCDVLIVTDVRFPDEAKAIKMRVGTLIKIVREGKGPMQNGPDQALVGYDGWDYVIGGTFAQGVELDPNDSMSGLRYWADRIARRFTDLTTWPVQVQLDRNRNLALEQG